MERAELKNWLRETGCAVECGDWMFLRDPQWSATECAEADAFMAMAERTANADGVGWLCVRTGGSGGGVKFARHDERTIGAAIEGFRAHFVLTQVNALGVLPPWHVSGLMARLRCAATGGAYVDCDWKALSAGAWPALPDGKDWVISLVPTQLQRLLATDGGVAWLRKFKVVLVGGGPMWPALADAAAKVRVPVALSYGMTETAAMIAAQRPEEFAAGDRSSGSAMPHARLRIDDESRVRVAGDSVFHGYFPGRSTSREFVTEDIGRIDEAGRLQVLGRRDAMIVTGGKKVQPADVEAALRVSGEFDDVAVIGVPDAEWGEAVVACYPQTSRAPNVAAAVAALAPHQRPKRFVAIADWPRTAQGKVNRIALAALVTK